MPGVTKEQIRQAREADLFAYLERHERGVLKRDGPNYRHKEHDSLVYVTAKNYWYWNSRGKRINALDYLMEIRGYDLVDAVNALAGPAMQYSFTSRYYQDYAAARQARKPDHCYLPWQKKCATSYVSYLQKRGISTVVIKRCTQLGILYEGSYKKKEPEGKATYIPVCVFVGKDEHGTAKFACMRGIHSDLRKDAYGSDKEYSFCLPPHRAGSRHVAVFEAPIDALSHATLQEMDGWKWDGYRLSLGGTSHVALFAFLERHPKIKHVDLYMDSDYAGLKNARKIKDMLRADPRFKHILTDERYAGTYVIGKRAVKEIGGTRSRLKDESEWIKIPDHHPAIVSMELYEQVNAVRRQFKQPNKQRRDYLLRGKVFCGYCDHAMSRKGKTTWFYCRHAEVSDNLPCHGLQVREKELEQAIFESIKAHMLPVLGLDICKDDLTLQSVQQAEQEKKLRALQDSKRKLYERYALGEIDLDSYKAEKEKYDIALVGEKNTHAMITARAKRAQGDYEANLKHQDLAKEIGSSTTLTKSLVDTLINKIYIFKDERIEIDYAVRDFFENETTQEMPSCGAEG